MPEAYSSPASGVIMRPFPSPLCLAYIYSRFVHVVMISRSSLVNCSVVSKNHYFPEVIFYLWLLKVFPPSVLWNSQIFSEKGFKCMVHLGITIDQLKVCMLIAIFCEKMLLVWGLKSLWVYGNSNKSSRVILILCKFGRILKSSLGLLSYLARCSDFSKNGTCSYWVAPCNNGCYILLN